MDCFQEQAGRRKLAPVILTVKVGIFRFLRWRKMAEFSACGSLRVEKWLEYQQGAFT
jgi:hypothetical protein